MLKAGENLIADEFSWIGGWADLHALITPNHENIVDNIEKNLYNYK